MLNITDKEFDQLTSYIKQRYGIKLGREKRSLVLGRLRHTLEQNNCKNFSDYYKYVIADKTGRADVNLVNMITTNHTFFMREVEHFKYFHDKVLPGLAQTVRDRDLRIWCAACSTGEEPYTLAMLIDSFFGQDKAMWDTKLLATDISQKALDTAQRGVYHDENLASVPTEWRRKYFSKVNIESSSVTESIKNEIIFRKFNLMNKVLPFKKKFHVIFCRNVMIYFDEPTKNELVKRFFEFTEDGGYLFIGHSESLNRDQTKYKYIMPAVYRKER